MSKGDDPKSGQDPAPPSGRLSRASVVRLSLYLRRLKQLHQEGAATVSSGQLGEPLGISDTQVRKDLAALGSFGQPGIGYPTEELIAVIRRTLGIDRQWAVVLAGVGNLARALLRYRGFQEQGFHIVALLDSDPQKIGQDVDGLQIKPLSEAAAVIGAT